MEVLWFLATLMTAVRCLQGPRFVQEPPRPRLDFSNGTGAVLPCSARGNPAPRLQWLTAGGATAEDVPGLRHVRPDGSLVFLPFRADHYRADVHDAQYRCAAHNEAGTVLGREVRVRGVVDQAYVVDVYDEFVLRGNTAVLRCRVPPQVQDYVTVTAWIRDGTLVIRPTALAGDRFSVFESGELHVRRVDRSDELREYRCETRHRLTGENVLSATAGRLLVTEAFREAPPRITSSQRFLHASEGSTLEAPCAAQGHPPPAYEWLKREADGSLSPLQFGSRLLQLEGALLIRDARPGDAGHYLCRATNSKGQATAETDILVTAPLSAQVSPKSLVVDVGRPASFDCSVSGHPVSRVEWTKDGRLLRAGPGIVFPDRLGLRLSAVRRQDAGMYQCFVTNELDSAQGTAQLALGDYPPTLLETFAEQTLTPGVALSLRCIAQARPLPQVTWTLDGAPVPDSGPRLRMGDYVRPGGHVISYVNVSSVRPEDGGLYACAAENGAGRAEHGGRVKVAGPPFVRLMSNATAVAGEVLRIVCPVGGHPIESVRWEKDGVRLPLNHRQKVYQNGTLEVRSVEKSSDAGKYTCIASNAEGATAQRSLHVTVSVRPVIDPFNFPKSLAQGQRYSVLCTVTQGDPPISISWSKDGHAPGGVRSVAVTPFSSSLVFDSVGPEQRGNYTCLAENSAGRSSHTATMVIHVPPKWRIEPSDSSATRGRPAIVDCQADGFPVPRIRWTKEDGSSPGEFRPISSSSRLQVLENGSLVVHSVQAGDAGHYLCQASNGVGQGLSKVVQVSVHVAAHFGSKFQTESVRKGEDAKLVCEAVGDRPMHVTWFKDKQAFEPQADLRYELAEESSGEWTRSSLTIRRADRRDSALYTCIAANAFGRDDTNLQLVVQEAPDGPQDAKVVEVDSRTVKIGWTPPYAGNSPIHNYVLQYKEEADRWQQQSPNVTTPGSDSSAVVRGLHPNTRYHFRVFAENAIGPGEPSNVVSVTTDQEAPGGPPSKVKAKGTGAHTIRVSWKPPRPELHHGPIEGYYVGYRVSGSEESFVYKTVGPREEAQVTGLKRLTEYQLMVQAFNAKGASPPSDAVMAKTLQDDPPGSPSVKVTFSNATSIGLVWEQTDTENAVHGFVVHHRWELGEWEENEVSGGEHAMHDLKCGSRYQFYVTAFNAVGRGAPSDTLRTKTQGRAPVAPDKQSLLTVNQTSAWVHLGAWSDGGCPISSFSVRYRQQRHQQWASVGVAGPDVTLDDLSPGTWYRLQVTARNEAGSTDAEYTFVTSPAHLFIDDSPPLDLGFPPFLDLSVLLPAAVSLAVVVTLVALVCVLARKKRDTAHAGSSGNAGRKGAESLPLSEKGCLEKSLSDPRGCYPTPYATTRIGARDKQAKQASEEPLYATVKRTPRPPRSDFHVYHYPGEMPEFFLQSGKGVDEMGASSSSVYWKEAPETKLSDEYQTMQDCSPSGGQRKSQRYSQR